MQPALDHQQREGEKGQDKRDTIFVPLIEDAHLLIFKESLIRFPPHSIVIKIPQFNVAVHNMPLR